jgi:hypothetical protein
MSDPLHPSASLLCKLGSIVVHYEELNSLDGHPIDKSTIDSLRRDPEVEEWFTEMKSFLPAKRHNDRQS